MRGFPLWGLAFWPFCGRSALVSCVRLLCCVARACGVLAFFVFFFFFLAFFDLGLSVLRCLGLLWLGVCLPPAWKRSFLGVLAAAGALCCCPLCGGLLLVGAAAALRSVVLVRWFFHVRSSPSADGFWSIPALRE